MKILEDVKKLFEQNPDVSLTPEGNKVPHVVSNASANAVGGAGGNGGAGGKGGNAINITYVDNYSIIMLMYTFMLAFIEEKGKKKGKNFQSLMAMLTSIMKEQQQFRKEFLNAIEKLQKEDLNSNDK